MSKRSDQAAQTKQKIVETAVEILSSQGPDALTSGSLSARLGMSKGTIFHHFGDMDGVQLGVFDHIIESFDQAFQKLNPQDLKSYLQHTAATFFTSIEQYRGVYAALFYYIGGSVHNPDLQARLKTRTDRLMNECKTEILGYIKPAIPDTDADRIVRMIDVFFSGLCAHDFIYQDHKKYKRITDEFMSMLIDHIETAR